jgi:hypothetical protein
MDSLYSVERSTRYITVATGDSNSWTFGPVYGNIACHWSSCDYSSLTYRHKAVHEAAQNLSQWQVATVLMWKIQVLRDIRPYILVGIYWHFGCDYCFLRQVRPKCRNMIWTCCRPTYRFKPTMGLQISRRSKTDKRDVICQYGKNRTNTTTCPPSFGTLSWDQRV